MLGCLTCSGCGGDPQLASDSKSSSQQAADGLTVNVTPNRDLLDEQTVLLTATGLPASTAVYIGQCALPGTTVTASCGGHYYQTTTRADGSLEASFQVQKTFTAYGGATIDCQRPDSCIVGVVLASNTSGNVDQTYGVPISFRQTERQVTVTPDQDLGDGQEVQVLLAGFPPSAPIRIEQCVGTDVYDADFNCGAESYDAVTTAEGTFQGTLTVRREFTTPGGLHVLCRGPWPCAVGASVQANPNEHNLVPIWFHEVPPTLTVTPNTNLTNLARVSTLGAGFPIHTELQFQECRTGSTTDCQWLGSTNTDEAGNISPELIVSSVIEVPGAGGMRLFECKGPGACSIRFYLPGYEDFWQATQPITFATTSPAHGTASIDLTSPLITDLTVRVLGSGWAPQTTLRVVQCKDPGVEACFSRGSGPSGEISTDAAGAFRTYQTVSGGGFFDSPDCSPPANGCSLVIADDNDLSGTAVRIPLNFVTGEQFEVSSSYEAKWIPFLQDGMRLSGSTAPELQLRGAAVTLWIMTAASVSTGTHLPRDGVVTYATAYSAADYRQFTSLAARFDYTLDELQKIGAVFYSWILMGMPPLPS